MALKKIAVVVGSNKQCGIYVFAERLRKALEANGAEAHLIPLPETTSLQLSCLELSRLAKSLQSYDLVINQHEPSFWGSGMRLSRLNLAWFADCLKGRVQHLLQMHTTHPAFLWSEAPMSLRQCGFKMCMQRIWNSVDLVVVHEERSKYLLKRALQWAEPKHEPEIRVHEHPCPTPTVKQSRTNPQGLVNLTIFGFLAYHKGHHTLIEFLNKLPNNYRLVIAGGTHPSFSGTLDYRYEVERLIHYHDLQDRVLITGWLDEEKVMKELSCADLAILPYAEEADMLSASGAVRELLSFGIPVLGSDIPAFLDIARKTTALKIFRKNDFDSLKGKLQSALQDYSAMSRAALNYCQEYSYEKFAQEILTYRGNDTNNQTGIPKFAFREATRN